MNFRAKTVCVIDNGLFIELAATLAKSFGRVLYFSPWTSSMPKSNALMVGRGVPGVERVLEPWTHIDDVDLFVFPDVYEAGLQEYLVSKGKRVWGCRGGADLELDRVWAKEESKKRGVDIGPYQVVTGLDNLRKVLKKKDDLHVKVSLTRGDFESFHSPSYEEIEPRLDELEHTLGAKKRIMDFIVEQGINDAIEVGYDGYCIDGAFPKGALVGVEMKDKAYVGKVMQYSKLPESVLKVNAGIAPILKQKNYRGFLSTEIRAKRDGSAAYFIDGTMRVPSPPGELYQLMISNLAEVLWYGAEGTVIEPDYAAKWGAEVILHSDWADRNWQQVAFPSALREHVKLRNFTVIDDEYYVIPQWSGMPEVGAVVAMGDTAKEAIERCKEIAEQVDGYSIEKHAEDLDKALENLNETLGDAASDKPPSKLDRKIEEARRKGLISDKALEKMAARG